MPIKYDWSIYIMYEIVIGHIWKRMPFHFKSNLFADQLILTTAKLRRLLFAHHIKKIRLIS